VGRRRQKQVHKPRICPGIVCGALGRFLVRTFNLNEATEEGKELLIRLFLLIEEMASDKDLAVQNLVVIEIFHHIDCDESSENGIVSRFFPISRALYDKWVK
jgi:hypothetical protein